jgi:serine/threonine protein kinase
MQRSWSVCQKRQNRMSNLINDQFIDLMAGLEYMHSERDSPPKVKIYHGDLKGVSLNLILLEYSFIRVDEQDNFLVHWELERGSPKAVLTGKITDFGLSSIISPLHQSRNVSLTQATRWLAPEIKFAEDDTVPKLSSHQLEKADVWSFAITALEIARDEDPFASIQPGSRFEQIRSSKPQALVELLPSVGQNPKEELVSEGGMLVLTRCWNLDSEERPTMVEVTQTYHRQRMS